MEGGSKIASTMWTFECTKKLEIFFLVRKGKGGGKTIGENGAEKKP